MRHALSVAESKKAGRAIHRCGQQERDSSGYQGSVYRRWDHDPSVQHTLQASAGVFRLQGIHGYNLELLGGLDPSSRLGSNKKVLICSKNRGHDDYKNP